MGVIEKLEFLFNDYWNNTINELIKESPDCYLLGFPDCQRLNDIKRLMKASYSQGAKDVFSIYLGDD